MSRTILNAKDAKTMASHDQSMVVIFSVYQYTEQGPIQKLLNRPHLPDEIIVEAVWEHTDMESIKAKGYEWFPQTVKIVSGVPGDSLAVRIMYGSDREGYVLWHAEVWGVRRK